LNASAIEPVVTIVFLPFLAPKVGSEACPEPGEGIKQWGLMFILLGEKIPKYPL
jgi:hypothetical protein